MSQLRSVITDATGFDPRDLSVGELAAEISEAVQCVQLLEVAIAGWTRSLSERDRHRDLGYSSPTAFLTDVGRMTPGRARMVVALGNAATRAPLAYEAWSDLRLSTDQAKHLFSAAETVPDAYPDAEEKLVEIVEGLDAVDTGRAVEYWRQAVHGPGELALETQTQRRGLFLSKTIGGMRRVDGWLTTTAGEALEAALTALTPPPRDGDTRTPRQRRHDALEDLARHWLDNRTTPTTGGEKPHINLHCDLPALQGIAGGLHETSNGEILDIDTLRMIACDTSITRIVLGPNSEILDVGRKTRVWSPAQRRAITARDRHCQGKGCHTRAEHCDIHHLDHWANGGKTKTSKGILLCRPCHTLEHLKEQKRRTKG